MKSHISPEKYERIMREKDDLLRIYSVALQQFKKGMPLWVHAHAYNPEIISV